MSLSVKEKLSSRPVLQAATGAVVAGLMATSGAAWADARGEVAAASVKFAAARTVHITMDNSDHRVPRMEADFARPDRYRIQMPQGTQYIIGNTTYMTISGHTMRVPMPPSMLTTWRQTDRIMGSLAQTTIEAQGRETVGGLTAKKYRLTYTTNSSVSLLWIGPDGYPLQLQNTGTFGGRTSTVTMHYSRYNDATIRINPPG